MPQTATWRSYGGSRWRPHSISVVVWLASVGLVVWLFEHRALRFEVVGVAQGEQRRIAALTNGRLLMVPVQLFDHVRQGQTLAVLADDRVQAQLATAAAEAARLRAELVATEDRLAAQADLQEAEQMAEARRFAFDVEQTRVRGLEVTVQMETDRITLQGLRLNVDRLRELRKTDACTEYELEWAETQYDALAKKIRENERVLAQVTLDLERVRQRQEVFAQRHPLSPALDKALEPLRAALAVQERRIGELSLERSMLVLRSPLDGIVSEVLRGVGEALMPGDPILAVAAFRPSEVIAYATAAQASQVEPGMAVELVTRSRPRLVAKSRVVGVGPVVAQLPMWLWRNPTIPEWGWPIRIAVSPELKLLSGELVGIRGL